MFQYRTDAAPLHACNWYATVLLNPVSAPSEIANIAFTPSNCVAATLNWTMSEGEAADTIAGDDNTGEPKLKRVWSKSPTPGLIEETEPIATPPAFHIG